MSTKKIVDNPPCACGEEPLVTDHPVKVDFHSSEGALFSFAKAMDTMQLGVTIADVDGKIVYMNPADAKIHGYDNVDELIGKDVRIFAPIKLWSPMNVDKLRELKSMSRDSMNKHKNGSLFAVHLTSDVIKDGDGTPIGVVTTCEDITERKSVESKMRQLSASVEQSVNIIFITDQDGYIDYVNPMFETFTGFDKKEVVGEQAHMIVPADACDIEYRKLWEEVSSGTTWHGVQHRMKKGGEVYWCNASVSPIRDEDGKVTNLLTVQEDITEKKLFEERISYISSYDEITGLVNRGRFMELLANELPYAGTYEESSALILFNADSFSYLNETYGHSTGDDVLKMLGELLKRSLATADLPFEFELGKGCVLGRLGADEFAIFIHGIGEKKGLAWAESVRGEVEALRYKNLPASLTASIGLVFYPHQGATTTELFTKANAAMFRAKKLGGNRCHIYREADHALEHYSSRLKVKAEIQKALKEDRFEPWFQPILNIDSGEVSHYEVLARMRDEDGKVLMPGNFIDIAERFGLIKSIDKTIIEKALRVLKLFNQKGKDVKFSMNLSGKNLGDVEFLNFLSSKISEIEVDPTHLVFEITETEAIGELGEAIEFIKALRKMGCAFSLDDFGVGFTSFVYLREMDVDYLKIDGSFIRNILDCHEDKLFVKAIIDVAKGMNVKTVAEFVTSQEILDHLKELNVCYAQGYHIGRPMRFEDIV